MTISYACPGCLRKLQIKDELAGKRLKCPRCSQVFVIPARPQSAGAKTKIQFAGESLSASFARPLNDLVMSCTAGEQSRPRRVLAIDSCQNFAVWEPESERQLLQFETGYGVGQAGDSCCALSEFGDRAITGGHDTTLTLWDVEANKQVRHFQTHPSDWRSIPFAKKDEERKMSDLASSVRRVAHFGAVNCVRFGSGDQTALSGGDDRVVRLWSVERDQELRNFKGHKYPVRDATLTNQGRTIVSLARDGEHSLFECIEICTWDVASGKLDQRAEFRPAKTTFRTRLPLFGDSLKTGGERSLTLAPNGRLVAIGCCNGSTLVWNHKSNRTRLLLPQDACVENDLYVCPCFTLAGAQLVTTHSLSSKLNREQGGGFRLVLWNVASGKELCCVRSDDSYWPAVLVAIAPDGREILVLSVGGGITRWSIVEDPFAALCDEIYTLSSVAFVEPGPLYNDRRRAIAETWFANLSRNVMAAATALQTGLDLHGQSISRVQTANGLRKLARDYSDPQVLQRLGQVCGDTVRNKATLLLARVAMVADSLD